MADLECRVETASVSAVVDVGVGDIVDVNVCIIVAASSYCTPMATTSPDDAPDADTAADGVSAAAAAAPEEAAIANNNILFMMMILYMSQ